MVEGNTADKGRSQQAPQELVDTKKYVIITKFRQFLPLTLIVIALILAGAAFFIARKPKEEAPEEEAGAAVITYWNTIIPDAEMAQIVENFETENPNITVNYENKQSDRYQEVLETRLKTNTNLPDVFEMDSTRVHVLKNFLAGSPSLAQSRLNSLYFPAAGEVCSQSGSVKCVPLEFDGLVMIYNYDWLQRADVETIPGGWAEFKQTAERLTSRTSADEDDDEGEVVVTASGAAMGTGAGIERSPEIVWLLMLQNGVALNEESGWQYMAGESGRAAAEVYASYYTDNIWAGGTTEDRRSFINGNTAMMFGTYEDLKWIRNANPKFQVRTVMPPQVSGQKNLSEFKAVVVASQSPYPNAAWKFAEYLASSSVQRRLFEGGHLVSSRRDLLHEVSSENQLRGLAEIYLSAEPVYMPDYELAREEMVSALDSIAEGEGENAESQLEDVVSELR